MYKSISVTDFITDLVGILYPYRDCRVRSIGADSDGYFVIHLVDEYDHEHVVRARCFEDKIY